MTARLTRPPGFFNFAILIGALLGLLTAGPLSDWISMRATIKNNGVREPEMRLPAMVCCQCKFKPSPKLVH